MSQSQQLFDRARRLLPGGVNSPVRAFKAVGGTPPFIASASGCTLTDVDGREYLDYIGSWGPMIAGHAHPEVTSAIEAAARRGTSFGAPGPLEVELAEEIVHRVPSVDMVRMVNSGTEATMSAVRLARAATRREVVIKFAGCYHGHADSFLIQAGSGVATLGLPDSPGVTAGAARDTRVARYNDLDSVAAIFDREGSQVAAVIVEPVAGNMGVVPPRTGFLEGLRALCDRHGALLIFDEVMTGFRVHPAGAQGLYSLRPDLSTFGKVIGGGLPVGAYGGRTDLMTLIAPSGPVYQAGTLSGNPLAMAAGLATLKLLDEAAYARLETVSAALEAGLLDACRQAGVPAVVQRVGSMLTLFFHAGPVHNMDDASQADHPRFARFFAALLEQGVHLPPSGYEAWFVSLAHDETVVEHTLAAARKALEAGR
ncbi:MAG: glutamate-1-semialdehyde-2,1-aminomutase [Candidatus Zixiibacteriota bacterium]|nr:MAG: glutamate-1-semialdehyde-2,1-aminomutase [candidate division Zixibacteria bacterium]